MVPLELEDFVVRKWPQQDTTKVMVAASTMFLAQPQPKLTKQTSSKATCESSPDNLMVSATGELPVWSTPLS